MTIKEESRLVKRIMDYLAAWDFDGYHVHGNGMQRIGEPDIDGSILLGGRWVHIKLEVKTPSGEPSPIQVQRLRKYHQRGYLVGVVTSVQDVNLLLAAYYDYWNTLNISIEQYLKVYGIEDEYKIWS